MLINFPTERYQGTQDDQHGQGYQVYQGYQGYLYQER
jgi:hypothetical protein